MKSSIGMETTVNFEDLFDFSPEPVDRGDPDYDDQPSSIRHLNTLNAAAATTPIQRIVVSERSSESPKTSKLSASLPTGWASNLSASYTGSSSPGSSGFGGSGHHGASFGSSGNGGSGELYGQLVEDLSSAVTGTSTSEVRSRRGRKPGQKSSKPDMKNKLERSRQSARECRARKKLRYQYLDDLILERERANIKLREELLKYQAWCHELDKGKIPDGLKQFLRQMKEMEAEQNCYQQL